MEKIVKVAPMDIERESMRIIGEEMGPVEGLSPDEILVLKRVIHTTADFEYVENLVFSEGAVERAKEAIKKGAVIVTDTNMAKTGINKTAAAKYGCEVFCFMADKEVAAIAKEKGLTRATVSMDYAASSFKDRPIIFAIGNAPTALIRISELIDEGKVTPALVIGAPVGFVNVVASKELILCREVPHIVCKGRKGGSNVAAAIVNAMLYQIFDREKEA